MIMRTVSGTKVATSRSRPAGSVYCTVSTFLPTTRTNTKMNMLRMGIVALNLVEAGREREEGRERERGREREGGRGRKRGSNCVHVSILFPI